MGLPSHFGKCFFPRIKPRRLTFGRARRLLFPPFMSVPPQPAAAPPPTGAKKPGTIQGYAHQSTAERMSTKAEETSLDRLLVDRFKNGDAAAFNEMVHRYWDRIYAMTPPIIA